MWVQTAILSLLGGLICSDRILFQFMLSRPVVTGSLLGFFVSDLHAGLITGAILELLWIDKSPIGTFIPPNETLVAVVAVSAIANVGPEVNLGLRALIPLSILCAIPFGILAQAAETRIQKSNDYLSRTAVNEAEKGSVSGISFLHVIGMAKYVGLFIILNFFSIAVCTGTMKLIIPGLPAAAHKALGIMFLLLPVIGAAAALNTIRLKGTLPLFCGIFLLMSILLEWF